MHCPLVATATTISWIIIMNNCEENERRVAFNSHQRKLESIFSSDVVQNRSTETNFRLSGRLENVFVCLAWKYSQNYRLKISWTCKVLQSNRDEFQDSREASRWTDTTNSGLHQSIALTTLSYATKENSDHDTYFHYFKMLVECRIDSFHPRVEHYHQHQHAGDKHTHTRGCSMVFSRALSPSQYTRNATQRCSLA